MSIMRDVEGQEPTEQTPLGVFFLIARRAGDEAAIKDSRPLSLNRAAEGLRDFYVSGEVSADFLTRLQTATSADPWTPGFALMHPASQTVIGLCSFKGPPDADGVVEIGYDIVPKHRSQGYATEAAQALVDYAFNIGGIVIVRAHTLPEPNASPKVLAKCGFNRAGEVVDPENGLIWRWEKHRVPAQ